MRTKLTAIAAATALSVLACGSNGTTKAAVDSPSPTTSTELGVTPSTTPPAGTPLPQGVFETSFPLEAWTAAGLPVATWDGFKHQLTLDDGSLRDECVHEDGTREDCFIGTYTPVGDHEAVFKDKKGSFRIRWQFDGNALTFTFDPNEGQPDDHVVWATNPWTKIG
jgi:hypothetical protein